MRPIHYLRCFSGIAMREWLRFLNQRGRFFSALVRPLVWLAIFATGFHFVLGVSIIPPYETYVPYSVYIAPGLIAMILMFNGMLSSLSMVYDREMGSMRILMVSPLPRWFLLTAKLLAGVIVSVLQAYAFLAIALILGDRAAVVRLYHGAAGADPIGADAGSARIAAVLGDPPAREFRQRHEFRDLSDVLRVLRALSAVACQGSEPPPL